MHYNNYVTVDLDILRENFRIMQKKANVPVMAVIKANAYGHGAVMAAKALTDAAFFGVASLSEALQLRNAGITTPILLLGPIPTCGFAEAVRHRIRPVIFSYADALALSEEAKKQNTVAPFHFAVDTGMGRIGFQVTAADADICQKIAALPCLECEGLFSHFAAADEADLSKAKAQAILFDQFYAMLQQRGVYVKIRHLNNSAGTLNFETHYDMVRAGIVLYGLHPSDCVSAEPWGLRPVLSWYSHITHVKTLEAGRGVSYGADFVTQKPTRVATIAVGYGDGYRRSLSGKFHVLIRGKQAPVLGRVCMDQIMVDVTDIPQAASGDLVTLLGQDADVCITAEEMGKAAGSFNYETVCAIGHRVPRVYLQDGKQAACVDYLLD